MKKRKSVAAFDFDGTITYRDSFPAFLFYAVGPVQAIWKFFLSAPFLIGFALKLVSRQKAKEGVLTRFFKGWPEEKLAQIGERFAREKIPKTIRPEALKRLKWHQERGDCLALVSASVDIYLKPWGKSMGFDHILTSRVEVDRDGKVTGFLIGSNCRREEKVRRLEESIGPTEEYELFAYGDSDGDHELLEAADHPFYRRMPSP